MSRDHWATQVAEPERGCTARSTIELEITAAHARCLDLEHHFSRTGRGIRKVHDLELAITGKYDRFHVPFLLKRIRIGAVYLSGAGGNCCVYGGDRRGCQRVYEGSQNYSATAGDQRRDSSGLAHRSV